jgi:Flp pilus assembly protein TadG
MRNKQPGQSLVEMALLSTLLVTLLLGAVDFARAYQAQVAIKNAIAEAGYFAAQNPGDDAGIVRAVKAELSGFEPAIEDGNIAITRSCAAGAEQTVVRLQYDYQLLFSFVVPGAAVMLGSETTVPQMGGC